MATRIVAIDGAGGAGKSTLAERLAPELDAVVVHTDDFAGWDNPVDWWPDLREQVLRLQRGLERDGADAVAQWESWMAAEDRYIADERPQAHADVVIAGH